MKLTNQSPKILPADSSKCITTPFFDLYL